MSISYGVKSRLIKPSDISTVSFSNATILSSGADSSGGYYLQFQPNNGGCGVTPDSSFSVLLLDNIPWTKITYQLYFSSTFMASCWDFNQGVLGNFMPFSMPTDFVSKCVNSFNVPQYSTQIVMQACDNNVSNFLSYVGTRTPGSRSFYVTRRRNTAALPSLASINVDVSCNSTGAGNYILLNNIYVF